MDRKKAFLQETAAHQDQTTISEQCEVEYDSDEDTDNVILPKADSTVAVKLKVIIASSPMHMNRLNRFPVITVAVKDLKYIQ